MLKKIFATFTILMTITFLALPLFAGESTIREPLITNTKKKIMILPAENISTESNSIETEVTTLIASLATTLGRFEVVDRNNLQHILKEQALQQTGAVSDAMIVQFGEIAAAKEALIVNVLRFSQFGVPPDDDDDDDQTFLQSIVSTVVKGIFKDDDKEENQYPNNIQTNLSVEVRKLDIETNHSLDSFNIHVSYTGGAKGKSRAEALKKFRKNALVELKKLYLLSSKVVTVSENEVLLCLGSDIGVRRGSVFEIIEPSEKAMIHNQEITIPGHSVGLVSVSDIASETNRSKVIRQWCPIKPGYRAVEFTRSVFALQFNAVSPLIDDYYSFGGQFHVRPIHQFDFGGGLRFVQAIDSRDHKNPGFGFGGFGSYRLLSISKLHLKAKVGLDIDILFRDDDEDNSVSAAALSVPVGLTADIVLSPKIDLVINSGYRFGGMTDNWQYTENENSKPGKWDKNAPEIDMSGYYFSAGLKFYLF